ncbi:hypothetical protein RUM43_006980 [Polyplax serrata]|uniref:Uncharacterized protein n=1 Tax=Polyplax serrata TaxID=468196 RepID=A0AAN8Q5J5_POLSC
MTDVENITFSIEKVYATKRELLLYLNLLGNLKLHPELHFPSLKEHYLDTNPIIQRFLQYDSSYCLADKYLIAMVFIYFKRAQLSPQDYTYLNFFAGLCLAQSMEEDIDLSPNIYPWALGKYVQNELPNLLELKSLLWQAMDHRAAVSYHCCTQVNAYSCTKITCEV